MIHVYIEGVDCDGYGYHKVRSFCNEAHKEAWLDEDYSWCDGPQWHHDIQPEDYEYHKVEGVTECDECEYGESPATSPEKAQPQPG
jgi:hypothetical protein